MTSKLPFGLKSKPTRRYINGYSIAFSVVSGDLYYTVINTTKTAKIPLYTKQVLSKEMLSKLVKVESFSELQTIEVVN